MYLLPLSLCVLQHPLDTFRLIPKQRDKFSILPAMILLTLMILIRLLSLQWTHFPLQTIDPSNVNWMMETGLLLVPVLSMGICTFAITSILDGQVKMGEAITSVTYAMMPYIVLTLPMALLSQILGQGSALYGMLEIGIYVWCAVLYVISVKVMNYYTLAKTLLIILLVILLMALMWAVVLLVLALWNQLKEFVSSVTRELRYLLLR